MSNRNYNKVPRDRSAKRKTSNSMDGKIKISMTKSQLEDFMWTSWRYCIGRRTAAAAMHTDHIAELIANNPNIFSQERLEFNARDIRREINQVCTYGDAIEVDTCRDIDVFSAVLYKSAEVDNPHEWIYYVGNSGDVSLYKPDKPIEFPFDRDYTDLVVWVKLANWLDKSTHRMVTTEFQGNTSVEECYPYPQKIDGKYHKVWARVSDPNISCNRWIAEEYITKIEELDNESED